jgi:CRISPR-associated endonuclease/helicase Cas3
MRDYTLDLLARGVGTSVSNDEVFIESLAFAEGRLLSIHPFQDFNGRVTRLWLAEILRRADWPLPDLVPNDEVGRQVYLHALAAADARDYRPLMEIWRERFGGASFEA